jgi:hypothetical protein
MESMHKKMALCSAGVLGIFGVLVMAKILLHRHHHAKTDKKEGIGLSERLKESKAALEKATARVQSAFDRIKNRKP